MRMSENIGITDNKCMPEYMSRLYLSGVWVYLSICGISIWVYVEYLSEYMWNIWVYVEYLSECVWNIYLSIWVYVEYLSEYMWHVYLSICGISIWVYVVYLTYSWRRWWTLAWWRAGLCCQQYRCTRQHTFWWHCGWRDGFHWRRLLK